MSEVHGNSAKARELSEKLARSAIQIGNGVREVEQANQSVRSAIKEDGYKQTENLVKTIKAQMMEYKEPILQVSQALAQYAKFLEEIEKRDS